MTCSLKNEPTDEEEEVIADDDETQSEDIFWRECEASGKKGYLCPAETPQNC